MVEEGPFIDPGSNDWLADLTGKLDPIQMSAETNNAVNEDDIDDSWVPESLTAEDHERVHIALEYLSIYFPPNLASGQITDIDKAAFSMMRTLAMFCKTTRIGNKSAGDDEASYQMLEVKYPNFGAKDVQLAVLVNRRSVKRKIEEVPEGLRKQTMQTYIDSYNNLARVSKKVIQYEDMRNMHERDKW